jgi:hypothetical protein
MKRLQDMTEQELRETEVGYPKSKEELMEYIDSLLNRTHDYGTCVYAMSMSAVAAFNYIAHCIGATGFQASCADLDILRRTRHIEIFRLIDYENFLYPQYEDNFEKTISADTWKALQDMARKKIEEADKEYAKYLKASEQYDIDIAAFIKKYPDYYERKKHYDPLGMGTGDEWAEEKKKKESGFKFAPQNPYCPVHKGDKIYLHWESMVNGQIPFGYTIKD